MARIFITGSSDGLGRGAAKALISEGHEVILHVRSSERLKAVKELVDAGAGVVMGDLSDFEQTKNLAAQVNKLGLMDAIIHNAGIYSGPQVLPVNVVSPYLLTVLIQPPKRLIYISSGMHLSGKQDFSGADWNGDKESLSYSDSKLLVTTLAFAVARLWPQVVSSAVDPGWVATKMGGPNAPDDFRLGCLTQEWLATSTEPRAQVSGEYWHHQQISKPHSDSRNLEFQKKLLLELARATGIAFPIAIA